MPKKKEEPPEIYIPLTVVLPFGYKIKIREAAQLDSGEAVDGSWLPTSRVIKLRSGLPPKRKLAVLCHEVQHAVLDWADDILDRYDAWPDP